MKLLSLLITALLFAPAVFAEGGAAQGPGAMGNIIFIVALFAMLYFLMIRPQTQRAKAHKNLMATLQKDDEIVTNGGLVGKITKVSEQFLGLNLGNNIEVTIQKQAVATQLRKGTLKSI